MKGSCGKVQERMSTPPAEGLQPAVLTLLYWNTETIAVTITDSLWIK